MKQIIGFRLELTKSYNKKMNFFRFDLSNH